MKIGGQIPRNVKPICEKDLLSDPHDPSQEKSEDKPVKQRCRLAKNVLKLKEQERAAFFSPSDNRCLPAPSTLKPEEKEFVVDSGASMHMISKKGLE